MSRKNQANLGITNVEFVKGEIENMPLPDDNVDVVISNCVVCLSPDKDAVFRESFRVLSPGGRIHLSDMMSLTNEGPTRTDPEAWASCIAGAEHRDIYLGEMDVVISNCVVCLSPDKDAVFRESFRVLSPGGRIHLSDMMSLTNEGPTRTDPEAWASCIAGAEHRDIYLGRLRQAGFVDIDISEENIRFDDEGVPMNVASVKVVARKPA